MKVSTKDVTKMKEIIANRQPIHEKEILSILSDYRNLTVEDLTGFTALDPISIEAVLKKLEAQGLVTSQFTGSEERWASTGEVHREAV